MTCPSVGTANTPYSARRTDASHIHATALTVQGLVGLPRRAQTHCLGTQTTIRGRLHKGESPTFAGLSLRGADRNRTGVNGFAGRCVATPPRRRGRLHPSQRTLANLNTVEYV